MSSTPPVSGPSHPPQVSGFHMSVSGEDGVPSDEHTPAYLTMEDVTDDPAYVVFEEDKSESEHPNMNVVMMGKSGGVRDPHAAAGSKETRKELAKSINRAYEQFKQDVEKVYHRERQILKNKSGLTCSKAFDFDENFAEDFNFATSMLTLKFEADDGTVHHITVRLNEEDAPSLKLFRTALGMHSSFRMSHVGIFDAEHMGPVNGKPSMVENTGAHTERLRRLRGTSWAPWRRKNVDNMIRKIYPIQPTMKPPEINAYHRLRKRAYWAVERAEAVQGRIVSAIGNAAAALRAEIQNSKDKAKALKLREDLAEIEALLRKYQNLDVTAMGLALAMRVGHPKNPHAMQEMLQAAGEKKQAILQIIKSMGKNAATPEENPFWHVYSRGIPGLGISEMIANKLGMPGSEKITEAEDQYAQDVVNMSIPNAQAHSAFNPDRSLRRDSAESAIVRTVLETMGEMHHTQNGRNRQTFGLCGILNQHLQRPSAREWMMAYFFGSPGILNAPASSHILRANYSPHSSDMMRFGGPLLPPTPPAPSNAPPPPPPPPAHNGGSGTPPAPPSNGSGTPPSMPPVPTHTPSSNGGFAGQGSAASQPTPQPKPTPQSTPASPHLSANAGSLPAQGLQSRPASELPDDSLSDSGSIVTTKLLGEITNDEDDALSEYTDYLLPENWDAVSQASTQLMEEFEEDDAQSVSSITPVLYGESLDLSSIPDARSTYGLDFDTESVADSLTVSSANETESVRVPHLLATDDDLDIFDPQSN